MLILKAISAGTRKNATSHANGTRMMSLAPQVRRSFPGRISRGPSMRQRHGRLRLPGEPDLVAVAERARTHTRYVRDGRFEQQPVRGAHLVDRRVPQIADLGDDAGNRTVAGAGGRLAGHAQLFRTKRKPAAGLAVLNEIDVADEGRDVARTRMS